MTNRCTRITIETERIVIVARQHAVRGQCEKCRTEAEFLPSDHAGCLVDTISGPLEQQRGNGFHQWPAKEGLICVCVKSLLRLLQAASGQAKS